MTLSRELPTIIKGERRPEITKDLNQLFDQAKNDRRPLERQWMLNLAFVYDQHWVFWNQANSRLERPKKVPSWRMLMVINLVKGVVRTEYAKLVQRRPQAKTTPASSDNNDRDMAKVCDAILEYLDATDGSEKAQKRALLWSLITGTGILHSYWNKAKGDLVRYPQTTMVEQPVPQTDPATGAPALDVSGQPVMTTQQVEVPHPKAGQPLVDKAGDEVHLGDEETCDISPFEFYCDPFGLTVEEKSWAFVVKLRSAEYIKDTYGVDVTPKEVPADNFVEGQMSMLAGDQSFPRKGVVEKRFWQRPNKQYPQGRYVAYVDDMILWSGQNTAEAPRAQMPFASFVHIPVPNRYWGDSMVTSLIDPQRNLNKGRSQTIEHRNLMTKGKYFVAKGALDVGQKITDMPGEIVEYNLVPGVVKPIDWHEGTAIPDSYWKDIEQSKKEIRDVSGVNEVSNAQAPGGVTAARAIESLQEQDDLRLGPTSQDYEDAIASLAKIRLAIARQNYDEPRTIRVTGKDNAVKVVSFYKEQIPQDVDVRVEAGASLPQSRIARQNFILSLWKNKVPIPPRVLIRMLELGEIEGIYDKVTEDVNQADRENDQLKAGQPVAVKTWHNHAVHVEEHTSFRKSEEYEQLVAADPNVEAVFDQHDADHLTFAAQIAATQAPPPDQPSPFTKGAPQSGVVGDNGQMPDLMQPAA